MSFVTTPRRASVASAPHRAAIRLLLPDPTGPPTPMRRARSTGKEALPLLDVDGGGEFERDRRGCGERAAVGGHGRRGALQQRREFGEPAGSQRRVEREQLEGGRRDGRGVVVEREQRGVLV